MLSYRFGDDDGVVDDDDDDEEDGGHLHKILNRNQTNHHLYRQLMKMNDGRLHRCHRYHDHRRPCGACCVDAFSSHCRRRDDDDARDGAAHVYLGDLFRLIRRKANVSHRVVINQ